MFGLLKTKNKDREVTTNPKVLFDLDIPIAEITIYGLKLGDHSSLIPYDNISTTTFEQVPSDMVYFTNGNTRFSWKNNKVYYMSTNGSKEYPLNDRINSVIQFGGILHMKSGAKYVIRENLIIGMGIHNDILKPYLKIKKNSIERRFGKATKINESYDGVDGFLFQTEYIIEKRNMKIVFSDSNQEILFINVGLFPYKIQTATRLPSI